MSGPDPAWDLGTDQSYLRESQYKTDVTLAARQSIYAYQQPRIDLAQPSMAPSRRSSALLIPGRDPNTSRNMASRASRCAC